MGKHNFFDSAGFHTEARALGDASFDSYTRTSSVTMAPEKKMTAFSSSTGLPQEERMFTLRGRKKLSSTSQMIANGHPFDAVAVHYSKRSSDESGNNYCATVAALAETSFQAQGLRSLEQSKVDGMALTIGSKAIEVMAHVAGDKEQGECLKHRVKERVIARVQADAEETLKREPLNSFTDSFTDRKFNALSKGLQGDLCPKQGARVEAAAIIHGNNGQRMVGRFFGVGPEAKLNGDLAEINCRQLEKMGGELEGRSADNRAVLESFSSLRKF